DAWHKRNSASAVRPATRPPLGECELAEIATEYRFGFQGESPDAFGILIRTVLHTSRLFRIGNARRLDRGDMFWSQLLSCAISKARLAGGREVSSSAVRSTIRRRGLPHLLHTNCGQASIMARSTISLGKGARCFPKLR